MNILQTLERFEKLHSLISTRRTGKPDELAKRLGVSRASLYVLIDEFNALNMPVTYSRKSETFYYKHDVRLTVAFKVEIIDNSKELCEINGGFSIYSVPFTFSDGRNLPLYSYLAEYKESSHRL
jgi:hypothetical protein